MSSIKLVIPTFTSKLPTCNPNLMPFHIDYTGPASVSAYMRVENLKPEDTTVDEVKTEQESSVEGKSDAAVFTAEVTTTTTTTITTMDVIMDESTPTTPGSRDAIADDSQAISVATSEDTLVVESQLSTSSTVPSLTPAPILEDADRRFVSTFRGRTIHGLTIDMPDGYNGLLLKSTGKETLNDQDENSKAKKAGTSKSNAKPNAKGKAKAEEQEEVSVKPRGRLTRSAAAPKKSIPIEIQDADDDESMVDAETDGSAPASSDPQAVRELVPTAQFSTFTLWHADRPVDKGRDEYARTLTEWVSLAHEIHFSDF